MKIVLERHRFAPELNKAYVGPSRVCVPAPGCTTIRAVREKLFAPLKYRGRFVTLRAENTPGNRGCNETRTGFCNNIRSLSGALVLFRNRHNLPGCVHTVNTRLIG